MILVCGIPTEGPVEMLVEALRRMRVHYFVFNQRRVLETEVRFFLRDGFADGWLDCGNEQYRLADFRGVFVRFMDDRLLPELVNEPEDSPRRAYSRKVHDALNAWIEVTGARVANRPSAMASNNSKPYQAQIIQRHGLRTPETLITNDPAAVLAFREKHGRVIYKSISGARSIVKTLDDADRPRLEKIRWCPTQFQQFIDGENVRVHVAGSQVFATRIESDAIDYRYARQQVGEAAELEACDLPEDLKVRCIAVSQALDLPLAGIDLKIATDGNVYCFEVNPCPGFSYYQASTGQPIATGIAEYLAGVDVSAGGTSVRAALAGG
jgi:glutathione synthase/RimK-type ligase-like ATP-grasp enzyme